MNEKATSPRVDLRWLAEDRPCPEGASPASTAALAVRSGASRLFGAVHMPDGGYPGPVPCAVMLHGYPGTARVDDVAQALRRCGVAVAVPHFRGAWGSEGEYSFTHIVEDAVTLANEVRSGELGRVMNADPNAVFLIGYSMGGWTALNAARSLPWLRGVGLLAPYDLTFHLNAGRPETLKELLAEGEIMRTIGIDALFEQACSLKDRSFAAAFDAVKDMNVAAVFGSRDDVAPQAMMEVLLQKLQARSSSALCRTSVLSDDHSFSSSRFAVSRFFAQFIAEALN